MHEPELKGKNRKSSRKRRKAGSVNNIAPDDGLRAYGLKCCCSGCEARREGACKHGIARASRQTDVVGRKVELCPEPFSGLNHKVHRTDPSAEGSRAEKAVEERDERCPDERRSCRNNSGEKPLEECERVAERNHSENLRLREVSEEQRLAGNFPAPTGRTRKEHEHQKLGNASCDREAVPAQEGLLRHSGSSLLR